MAVWCNYHNFLATKSSVTYHRLGPNCQRFWIIVVNDGDWKNSISIIETIMANLALYPR